MVFWFGFILCLPYVAWFLWCIFTLDYRFHLQILLTAFNIATMEDVFLQKTNLFVCAIRTIREKTVLN